MRKFFVSSDDFFYIIKTKLKKVKSIRLISTGWTNFVFEVKAKGGKYIFRFPRNNFFAEALEKECKFLRLIDKKGVGFKLPTLSLCQYKHRPYSMHKALRGKPLSQCDAKKLNNKKLAKDICKFMINLKNVKVDMPLITTGDFLENLSHVSESAGKYDLSKHMPLVSLENEGGLVLCHGDLNPGNILIRRGKMVAVLDFAFVSICSPLDDLARLLSRCSSELKQPLLFEFERSFNIQVSSSQLEALTGVWDYVEERYVAYIRKAHPDIVLPEKFS